MATHGGPGRGGGRKKGSLSKRTVALRAIADKALASGITPLEVMLDNMRFYYSEADDLLAKIVTNEKPTIQLLEALNTLRSFRAEAEKCAVDAAPYMHPKLSTIVASAKIDSTFTAILGDMTPQQAMEAYASMIKEPCNRGAF
jgi:hypothetical protein